MKKKCLPRKAKGGVYEDIKKPKGRAIVNKMEKGGVKVDDIKKPKGRAIVNKMFGGGPFDEDVTVGSSATTDGGSTQDNSNGGGNSEEKGGGISASQVVASIKGLGAGADVMANVGGKKKKTGKDVVASTTGMMSAGAGIGSVAGPIGGAIGAGAGLLVGLGTGLIDKYITNKKIAKANAKAKAELIDSYSKSLVDAKLASSDSYSLNQSKLNGTSLADLISDQQLTDMAKAKTGMMAKGGVKIDDIKNPKGRAIVNGMKDGGSKGGEVVGPGGPKEDKVAANIPDGSFVVPAENAHMAKAIRSLVLGDTPTKKAAVKSGKTNVKLSDGEHVFTPKEVKLITAKGIDLNALAPNADTMLDNGLQKLADGGTKKAKKKDIEDQMKSDYSKLSIAGFEQKYGVTIEEFKKDSTSAANKAVKKMEESPKSAKTQSLKTAQKNPQLIEDYLNETDQTKARSLLNKIKVLYPDKVNALSSHLTKIVSVNEKNKSVDQTQAKNNQYNDFDQKFKKKVDDYNALYEKAKNNPDKYSPELLQSLKNNADNYKKYYKNFKNQSVTGKNENELSDNRLKIVDYFKKNHFQDYNYKTEPSSVSTAQTVVSSKTAVPAGNPNIPTVTLDANGNAIIAPSAPKTATGTGTGKRLPKKGAPAAKRETVEPIKQIPATFVTDNARIDKELAAMTPTASTASTTTTPPKTESKAGTFAKIADALGGPAGLASLGQVAIGLIHSEATERPLDHVSPELMLAYKDAIATKTELANEADYGLSDKVKVSAKNEIEANRLQAMNDIVAVTSGQGANASLRQLAQDKNKAIVGLDIADADAKLKKKQLALAAGDQVASLANSIDQRRRKIFEDDSLDYQQKSAANADLINAGLTNFVNNLAYQKGEKDRAAREEKYGNTTITIQNPNEVTKQG